MKSMRSLSGVGIFRISFIFGICLIFTLMGCSSKSPVQEGSPHAEFPATLADSIPFDRLGSGKLVFGRIGEFGNSYQGVYVIDIDHRRSWGISGGIYDGPAVSPDGEKIAYVTLKIGLPESGYDVYVMNVDGTGSQRVSDIEGRENSPSWTPDGKQIVFYSYLYNTPGIPVYSQSAGQNPSDRTIIVDFYKVNPPYVYWPLDPVAVSPDGRMVVLADYIWTFDRDGSNVRHFDRYFHSPAWSPDGKTLAGLSVASDSDMQITSVSVILFDSLGAEPTTLISLPASGTVGFWAGTDNQFSLCWSPDGSKIAFTRQDGIEYGAHIFLINRDGTALTQVTNAAEVTDMSLSWSR